jgi:hypothetical protein
MSTVTSSHGANYEKLPPPVPPESAQESPPLAKPDATVGELISLVSEQTARLVRDELALTKLEAKQKAKVFGLGIGAFAVAGGLAFFGACCAVTAAILGFANVLQPWLAAVLVAGICFVLALFVVLPGWKGITSKGTEPPDALQSVKDDVAAVREAVHRK